MRITPIEDGVAYMDGERSMMRLLEKGGQWTLTSTFGHAHLESREEGEALAEKLLDGDARFVQEYRGETLAATWIEERVEDWYERRSVALFLVPFEAEEWTLRPGETWVQKRIVLRPGTPEGSSSTERIADAPVHANSDSLAWLEETLGLPPTDFRWATMKGRLAVPVPAGWRRTTEDPEVFAPYAGAPALRVETFFREDKGGGDVREDEPVPPRSVERDAEAPYPGAPEWRSVKWQAMFTDGREEMMARVTLLSLAPDEELADAVDAALFCARLIPGAWALGG